MVDNTNSAKDKKSRRTAFLLIILIFGFGVIMGSLLFCIGFHEFTLPYFQPERFIQVSADIVDVEKSSDSEGFIEYDIYVTYQYDKTEYNHIHLPYSDSDMHTGDNITIIIDSLNPSKIYTGSTALMFFGGGFAIFSAFFLVFLLVLMKKSKKA